MRRQLDPSGFGQQARIVRAGLEPVGQLAACAIELALGAEAANHQHGGLDIVRPRRRGLLGGVERTCRITSREPQAGKLQLRRRGARVQLRAFEERALGPLEVLPRNGDEPGGVVRGRRPGVGVDRRLGLTCGLVQITVAREQQPSLQDVPVGASRLLADSAHR